MKVCADNEAGARLEKAKAHNQLEMHENNKTVSFVDDLTTGSKNLLVGENG